MTIKLASLKADLKREEEGDWIDYPSIPGLRLNVSSLLKHSFVTKRDLLLQRLARKYKGKPAPPAVMSREMGRLYHEEILHGWEGLDEPYSRERAEAIMTDPEYRNLVAAVQWCAAHVSEVDVEYVEEETENFAEPGAAA